MPIYLGQTFPNFRGKAFHGDIKDFDLYEYINDSWSIFFSHPDDFTPVCTTELGKAAQMYDEFKRCNCLLIAFSCNSVDSHKAWSNDILAYSKVNSSQFPFPILADPTREIATNLGIMDADDKDATGLPLTCRSAFFIGPDKKLKASVLYPASTGRSLVEFLRVLKSLQLASKAPLATPEGWVPGSKCMISPSVPNELACEKFPNFEKVAVPSGKEYIRLTPDPGEI